jgi:hypothetical protein
MRVARIANCHPERKHFAKGFCHPCYVKDRITSGKQRRYAQDSTKLVLARKARYALRQKIRDAAKAKPCKDCGKSFPSFFMEFDHLPEFEKKYEISRQLKDMGLIALQVEIDKCDVLCVLCHRVRTWNRQHPDTPIKVMEGANVQSQ